MMVYWDYLAFGDSFLPPTDTPGSKGMWHDFKIIHGMYSKWDALRQESDEVVLDPKKHIADKYIPIPPPKPKGKGSGGNTGRGNLRARAEAAP